MTTLTEDMGWVKGHAILIFVVVGLSIAGIYTVENIISKHDDATNARWQAINQAQIAQVQTLSDRIAADEKERAQENAQQTAILANLATTIAQRDKTTAVVVQKDATLSASEAAQKIAQQTKAKPGEVVPQTDNVLVDLPMARVIAANLDQLPAIQADLSDTQKQLVSETTIATNLQGSIADKQKLIDAMNVAKNDADKACQANIASVKASARKSKWRWFGIGYVLGLASAHFIGI